MTTKALPAPVVARSATADHPRCNRAPAQRESGPDPELATVRRLTRDLRPASTRRYLVDVVGSAIGAWTVFALAVSPILPAWAGLLAGALSSVLLYRGLMFIHELYHQPGLRIVRHVWHVSIGIPTLLPLLLYQAVHHLHHRPDTYGTAEDGEYDQLEGRSRRMAAKLLLLNPCMPLVILLRFGLLGPLAWILPVVRHEVLPRFANLTMRMPFTRYACAMTRLSATSVCCRRRGRIF